MARAALLLTSTAAVLLFLLAIAWDPYPGDLTIALFVQKIEAPGLLWTMQFLSVLGKGAPMIALALFIVCVLWISGMRAASIATVLVLLSVATNPLMKLLVDRERPAPELLVRATEDFSGLGFPSGHAFQSALLFGLLIYISAILIQRTWLRWSVQASLGLLILSMGLSRVYIGAHWPSDVLGGYAAAVPFGLAIYLYHRRVGRRVLTAATTA